VQTERPAAVLAGRYALQEEMGRSGTGMVWRAVDTVLDRVVAVKVLRPELADDPAFAERLADEARAVAAVSDPGIAHLLDTGTQDGVSYLVREHVEGDSLRAVLERDGPLPAGAAVRTIAAVLDSLDVAHRCGALHLDLTPENVVLSAGGHVRVTDLGLGAAVRGTRRADEAERILAPAPEAPEQRTGDADARTDVYQAGCLLDQLLGDHVPADLRDLLERARAEDPSLRPETAAAFADALRGWLSDNEQPPSSERPEERWLFRRWLVVPALVVLAAAVAIAAGLWLGRLEIGGPLGIRPKPQESPPKTTLPAMVVLPVVGVSTFDPYGDGSENDSSVSSASDGDAATAWRSENYFDARLNKPGVGLVFDLGEDQTVTGFRLQAPHPGYTFAVAVGDDPEALASTAEARFTAEASMRVSLEPVVGRYVLLWITSVVDAGDGNRAEVAEFRVAGPDV
jgi:serine/threonine protein kinase